MRPTLAFLVPVLATGLILATAGCDQQTARSDYPDNSPQTHRQIDEIQADATARRAAVDKRAEEKATAITFHRGQITDKAKADRAKIALDHDQAVAPLAAKREAAKVKYDAQKQEIATALAKKQKDNTAEEAPKLLADAASQTAEVERKETAEFVSIDQDIRSADDTAAKKKNDVDAQEAKDLADCDRQLTETKNQARADKLAVDKDVNGKVASVEGDSKSRMEKAHANEDRSLESDRKTSAAVRADLDGDKAVAAKSSDVAITTRDGIVTLTGTVPSDYDRHAVIAKAGQTKGVKSVVDQMSVR
ncbi:MAG: BON domain-containing protein [Planctomycetes bacterium]|nr:BON domain-containing protein [Planctomycetota bacterium]